MSSAKGKNSNLLEEIEILLIYNKNNRGPSTDRWGTPQTTGFFFIPLPFSRPWIQFVLFGIILLDMSRTIWQWHHVIHDDIIYTAKHCGQHLSKAFRKSIKMPQENNLSSIYFLLHIMCAYQCDKAVNKNNTREVIWYHFTEWNDIISPHGFELANQIDCNNLVAPIGLHVIF